MQNLDTNCSMGGARPDTQWPFGAGGDVRMIQQQKCQCACSCKSPSKGFAGGGGGLTGDSGGAHAIRTT